MGSDIRWLWTRSTKAGDLGEKVLLCVKSPIQKGGGWVKKIHYQDGFPPSPLMLPHELLDMGSSTQQLFCLETFASCPAGSVVVSALSHTFLIHIGWIFLSMEGLRFDLKLVAGTSAVSSNVKLPSSLFYEGRWAGPDQKPGKLLAIWFTVFFLHCLSQIWKKNAKEVCWLEQLAFLVAVSGISGNRNGFFEGLFLKEKWNAPVNRSFWMSRRIAHPRSPLLE